MAEEHVTNTAKLFHAVVIGPIDTCLGFCLRSQLAPPIVSVFVSPVGLDTMEMPSPCA
jgi:hypothetical protein